MLIAFQAGYLSDHLHEFLPGLSAVLSFASLSVRPSLYRLFEDYIVQLPSSELRPVLKSLILSLLPALEEETNEDYERAFRILETLEQTFSGHTRDDRANSDQAGYYWQCLFLAVITSPSRRQGSLNYLAQRLPKFAAKEQVNSGTTNIPDGTSSKLLPEAEVVVSPEPGLLIRCFLCGLSDLQLLAQRGFLDLLVAKLPLNSPLLQYSVGEDDFDRLVSAAIHVLLRRDMSLNRRLWSWFLGPDQRANAVGDQPTSSNFEKKQGVDTSPDVQYKFFSAYGKASLERCVLAMFRRNSTKATERARPFRICLSLMDRWEIGGSIVPQMFLPAMESSYQYGLLASSDDISEVLRSASLFFDAIEASLIWSNLLRLLRDAFSQDDSASGSLHLFSWIIQRFNIKDEEMLTIHIPSAAMYLLCLIQEERDTYISAETKATALDIVSTLLEMVPERAFMPSTKPSPANGMRAPALLDPKSARKALDDLYQESQQSSSDRLSLASQDVAEFLYMLVASLTIQALSRDSDGNFTQAVSLLLILHAKVPQSKTLGQAGLSGPIIQKLDAATTESRTLSFPTISSIMSLITNLGSDNHNQPVVTRTEIRELASTLTSQLWRYLSPSLPKYHVEAVKLIWQLQDYTFPDDCLQASLTALVRQGCHRNPTDGACAETARRFTVLWGHTIPAAASGTRHGMPHLIRRGSSMPSISDTKQALHRQKVLEEPLMLILDLLSDNNHRASEVVKEWLHNLPSLEQVFNIHFRLLTKLILSERRALRSDDEVISRYRAEKIRDLEYVVGHFLSILKHSNDWIWQCLGEISLPALHYSEEMAGVVLLTDMCTQLLGRDDMHTPHLDEMSVELLDSLLSSPTAISLNIIDLDSSLLERLMEWLSRGEADLQGPLLKLVTKALGLRLVNEPTDTNGVVQRRGPTSAKRSSVVGTHPSPNASTTAQTAAHPPQLLGCLRMGFSSHTARAHLDQWLAFLSGILPMFADAIFASLIPLVECFCNELHKTHGELVSTSTVKGGSTFDSPEATAMALLEGLEMILAHAHECLIDDHNAEHASKATSQPRGLLGNVTSGVFKVDVPPSRTSQANSRLTVILTLQDAIRVSLKLWVWGSHCTDVKDFDKASAATTLYNALKVRNRTRHMLEQIFSIEPLESLEVVISNWCYMPIPSQANPAIDLLHVMQGSRPKNVVPAILDALCSRTNPNALPPARQSSQTIDLGALDVALFLSAYLQSTEDDAMDEVWSDCVAFLRDVLGNPLPYRQVLPALLAIILLLAQKVDNTNFGEHRKMRRDLGDIFLRLLAATFTTMPAGFVQDAATAQNEQTVPELSNSANGQRRMSLVIVLTEVMANAEVILETMDRTTTAVNSISSSLIAPLFHARTFPANITSDVLAFLLQTAKKTPAAKSWKKELLDAFNDARLLTSSTELMEDHWFPVLAYWCLHDKERMPELLSRLAPPSSAGIMFGVGASAARLEADRKTQLNLRRICLLLLASPEDTFVTQSRIMAEKLVELFDASLSSSPSSAVKAELFMLCRALVLSTSNAHLAPMWPITNDSLQSALTSLLPSSVNDKGFGNLSLLQACKLLDLLVILSPDEFQLHEWLYITDTIDAVYGPPESSSSALSDQIAEALASEGVEDSNSLVPPTPMFNITSSRRRPLIDNESIPDTEDLKAIARDDFAKTVLRPFLSQLSIHAYEGVYSMETPDVGTCRRGLLEDLLDLSTIVE